MGDIARSEVRDGTRIDWDVPITMDDGIVLRAAVYRPPREGTYPVILSYGPDGREVVFQGALDPHTPVGQGWLRASHRKPDPRLSTEYRPYHTHDEVEPLTPGEVHNLDVEIWPTCILVPAGYRIAMTVRGKDYEYPGGGARLKTFMNEMKGCVPFLHDDPEDRFPAVSAGRNTLYSGGKRSSCVLLPVIPKEEQSGGASHTRQVNLRELGQILTSMGQFE